MTGLASKPTSTNTAFDLANGHEVLSPYDNNKIAGSAKRKIHPSSPAFKSDDNGASFDESESEFDDNDSDFEIKKKKKTPSPKKSSIRKTGKLMTSGGGRKATSTTHADDKSPRVKREKLSLKEKTESLAKISKSGTKVTKPSARAVNVKREAGIKRETGKTADVKRKIKKEEEVEIWRWWEEKKYDDGRKWTTLAHHGPVFADPYQRIPPEIKFYYDDKHVVLSENAEEAMTFYSKMLAHDYTKKELFNKNFMDDWRGVMTSQERSLIRDISKCNFSEVSTYFERKSEERKNMTKEEKNAIKEANEKVRQKYGFCHWDNHRQPVGNYKIEPPGLFRGRGEHPKQGCIKKRIQPEDVTINCDRNVKCPEPPVGHRWKEIRHDNKVSWLATWVENIMGNNKYIMLNPSARVKAERDWQKYEKARKLHRVIDQIRTQYRQEWKSKEMRIRQRAVALYFIDQLALRVGNEKDEDEADTVGCCSLRFEHIKLHSHLPDFGDNVVEFDFLGKDSIRYHNFVSVDIRVYKNVNLFLENKSNGDELFDRVTTTSLNQFLTELMPGLSAKVFRTYNASRTLHDQLEKLTCSEDTTEAKILSYNRANREVAILCNHQRSIPKSFDTSMEKLKLKINAKRDLIRNLKKDCKNLETDFKNTRKIQAKKDLDKKKIMLTKAKEQLSKIQIQATDKEENKQIALSTSKLNYLDPRISVAWCKKHGVPIEKIYSKTQRDKFTWAMHMADESFHFYNYTGEIQIKEEASDDLADSNEYDDVNESQMNVDDTTLDAAGSRSSDRAY